MIGKRIRLIRQANQLSLQQLAQLLTEAGFPITKGALSNYETGKVAPSIAMLETLGRKLGVAPTFFSREGWDDFSTTLYGIGDLVPAHIQEIQAYVQIELERVVSVDEVIGALPRKRDMVPIPIGGSEDDAIENVVLSIRDTFGLGRYAIASVSQFLEEEGWLLFLLPGEFIVKRFSGIEHSHDLRFIFCEPSPYLDEYRSLLLREFGRWVLDFPAGTEDQVLSRFSRALLFPRPCVISMFGEKRTRIRNEELLLAKHKYGLSRRQVMDRLRECQIICEDYYTDFIQYLDQHRFLSREASSPSHLLFHEEATRYSMHVAHAKAEGVLSGDYDAYFW